MRILSAPKLKCTQILTKVVGFWLNNPGKYFLKQGGNNTSFINACVCERVRAHTHTHIVRAKVYLGIKAHQIYNLPSEKNTIHVVFKGRVRSNVIKC